MSYRPYRSYLKPSFSLLEVIIAVGIFLSGAVAIYSLFSTTLQLVADEKSRTSAFALLEQQMELAHNLPYAQVGVVGGIPDGSLPLTVVKNLNNIDYAITTEVTFRDDPFDGTFNGNPHDPIPTDYKRVRMSVTWASPKQSQTAVLMTDISPAGTESALIGGHLVIDIVDASGLSVPQASVQIKNSTPTPPIDVTLLTNDHGQIELLGTPPAEDSYFVSATKDGYSTDQTYVANPPTLTIPDRPPFTVPANQTTTIGLRIDKLSSLTITSQHQNGLPLISDIPFGLTGFKTIGSNANANPPPDRLNVLKYPAHGFIVSDGSLTINNLEWDSYDLTNLSIDYDLANSSPPNTISLEPNINKSIVWTLVPHADHTLRVIAQKGNGDPLVGANVSFNNNGQTLSGLTNEDGQIFFTPLETEITTLNISAVSYLDYATELEISGQTVWLVKLSQ